MTHRLLGSSRTTAVWLLLLFLGGICVATTTAWVVLPTGATTTTARTHSSSLALTAVTCPAMAEGERTILDYGPSGPILVTKVAGNYYAVDATCPHLNLPMKKGKITASPADGAPILTCNFHNSCFNMETGACTQWVTGALGVQNNFISGIMNKVGSEQKDITAYTVTESEDGTTLTIE